MKIFFTIFLLALALGGCSDMKTPDVNSEPAKTPCLKDCRAVTSANPNKMAASVFRTPDIATCGCR